MFIAMQYTKPRNRNGQKKASDLRHSNHNLENPEFLA